MLHSTHCAWGSLQWYVRGVQAARTIVPERGLRTSPSVLRVLACLLVCVQSAQTSLAARVLGLLEQHLVDRVRWHSGLGARGLDATNLRFRDTERRRQAVRVRHFTPLPLAAASNTAFAAAGAGIDAHNAVERALVVRKEGGASWAMVWIYPKSNVSALKQEIVKELGLTKHPSTLALHRFDSKTQITDMDALDETKSIAEVLPSEDDQVVVVSVNRSTPPVQIPGGLSL